MKKILFEYELMSDDKIREHIRNSEGKHVQQVAFSTYMDCITQICFTEKKIRSGITWDGTTSSKPKQFANVNSKKANVTSNVNNKKVNVNLRDVAILNELRYWANHANFATKEDFVESLFDYIQKIIKTERKDAARKEQGRTRKEKSSFTKMLSSLPGVTVK